MTEMKKLEKEDMKSADIVKENIGQLKQLFPEVFSENKINFEKLEEVLGNYVNQDEDHYNFTWYGKKKAARLAQTPSTGTLRPAKDESVDFDNTQNLFIEGDNLEVLKLLQKSYHRKVKMIYIDPPYNTGKNFVYKDDFKIGVKNYLKMTGQINSEGKKLGTNSNSAGRYHTNWLNMMYPRLKLARNLLRDDGVIFISIDDNEQANLKKICDEVFGEENFVGKIVHKNNSSKNQAKLLSISTEYIFCYTKNIDKARKTNWKLKKKGAEDIVKLFKKLKGEDFDLDEILKEVKDMYKRPKYSHLSRWNKIDEKGIFKDADLSREGGAKNYTIKNPETGKDCVIPKRGWGKSYDELLRLQEEGLIWYGDGTTPPRQYNYIGMEDEVVPDSFFYYDNSSDTREIKNMFKGLVFENPKPREMIYHIMSMIQLNKNDLILDFFAGSGTTAHAVMQLNSEDGGNRKCISVQLPEKTDEKSEAFKAGYKNIAEISKERIRRAAKKIKQENPDYQGDLGFKVFKLDSSNIKRWDASFDNLKQNLIDAVDYIKQDRSNDDIVYEILLKYGLDLAVPIEIREIAGAKIYIIGLGALVICLDKNITMEVVNGICTLKTELSPEIMRVVFSDNGFRDDVIKTNAIATLKRAGIEDIKSF